MKDALKFCCKDSKISENCKVNMQHKEASIGDTAKNKHIDKNVEKVKRNN